MPDAVPRARMAQLALAALGAGAVVPAAAVLLVGFAPAAVALAVAGHLAGAGLALVLLRRGYPHGDLGLCNLVTLTRLALASALLAPLLAPASSWAVLGVAIAALALDGVDGWLARREGRVSAFGARLDVEVDAALGLILALNAWASGAVGAGVLLLGLPRYGYIAAGWALPEPAPPQRLERACDRQQPVRQRDTDRLLPEVKAKQRARGRHRGLQCRDLLKDHCAISASCAAE